LLKPKNSKRLIIPKTKLRLCVLATLMSDVLGADASNGDINPIYFLTANDADSPDGANGCRQGTLFSGVEALINLTHFFDL
jgi:hypothetical protein